MLKWILIAIIVIMVLGGLWFYIKKFVALGKEFAEFVKVVFLALKDKRVNQEEKAQIIKEFADMKPILKSLKIEFIENAKEVGGDLKDLYKDIKGKIKNK